MSAHEGGKGPPASGPRHGRLLAIGLLVAATLVAACAGTMRSEAAGSGAGATVAGRPARADVPDPGSPGPYRVGVTRRTFVRISSTNRQPRPLETVIWYPAGAEGTADPRLGAALDVEADRTGGPYPIALFSHGSGGEPWQSRFLTTHLASHGFVVVAPPHPGNTTTDCAWCLMPGIIMGAGMIDSAINRQDDLITAYERVTDLSRGDDALLHGLVDPDRAGVAGHSFGAYSAVKLIGSDHRFRAAVPMAIGMVEGTRAQLEAAAQATQGPVMLMGGERDGLIPFSGVQALYESYPAAGPEHWLIAFPRGGHFAYSDVCPPLARGCGQDDLPQPEAHARINRWATAFLLRSVAGDDRYAAWLDPALAAGDREVRVSVAPGS